MELVSTHLWSQRPLLNAFGLLYPDTPWLVGLHNLSDFVIGLAYVTISATLAWLVYRGRGAIPFSWMILAVGAFILGCGFTHFMHVLTAWRPQYWGLLALAQAVTVVASFVTAVFLPPLVSKMLALIGSAQLSDRRGMQLHHTITALEAKSTAHARAQEALRQSEARFQSAFDHAAIGMALVAPEGRWLGANRALCTLIGYTTAELLATTFQELTHPDDLDTDLDYVRRLLSGEIATYQLEKRYIHKDGHPVWALLSVSLVRATTGEPLYFVSQIQDIGARKEAEKALRASEARYRQLFESNRAIKLVIDPASGAIVDANPAACAFYGYPREALTALTITDLNTRPPAEIAAEMAAARAEKRDYFLFRHRLASGEIRDVEVHSSPIEWYGRQLLFSVVHDITERKMLEAQLIHQAFHDALTGLPNRTLFQERLRHALTRATRRPDSVAVLFLDLDRFKVVNDSLGHATGDRLLVAVGQRLLGCVRPADTVARLGGDEFTILLEDIADVREAIRAAERVLAALQGPFALDGREIITGGSIGIALGTREQDRPADLLRDADVALYRAKARGQGRFEVFDPGMNARALERLELEGALRHALSNDQLRLHYQPQIDLATGQLVGVEALVRWEHPEQGAISPADFVPIAEETGLIRSLGRWVLAEACRQAADWQLRYPDMPLVTAVNLSAREFQHPDLVDEVVATLRETGLDPSLLKLEITEGTVMEDAAASRAALQRLKTLGVQLAIDDFGTGYSSLAYLKRFPVDTLKIDRAFVKGLGHDPEDTAIVRAIIALAHTLGLEVTAEGVETVAQAVRLRELGCNTGQGYLFARPLAPAAFEVLVAYGLPRSYSSIDPAK